MNHRTKALVLVSGGMDSVTLLHHLHAVGKVSAAISFTYGARHHPRELPWARYHCAHLAVPWQEADLEIVARAFRSSLLTTGTPVPDGHYTDDVMRQTVVPFRNGILLSIAAGLAESRGADAVAIGAHTGDHTIYPDCRMAFMKAMRLAIQQGTHAGIRLWCPFQSLDKGAIVRRGLALGLDYTQTWSCYKGGERHCGTCGTCVERREAFQRAGVADPTEYDPISRESDPAKRGTLS